ncbi:MAG: hypothetical protein AYK22_01350 [Thermoplasmatales archaeon SG8-52-3]|nr:MAG: hypothetical protein AYK22_01350 [Thermoplasmatales archaeon SG8-52-3]
MFNKIQKRILFTLFTASLFIFSVGASPTDNEMSFEINGLQDLDPLVDLEVTVEIQAIRSLQKFEYPNPKTLEAIDWFSDPDFFVKVIINDQEFVSDIWYDTKYIYNPDFSPTLDVSDEEEFVNIKIQLYDWNAFGNVLCDLSANGKDVELTYSLKTGHWSGGDFLEDSSGYGRLNGCADGSMYKRQRDCELWFNIYQNDFDGDGIPYWTEVNEYDTDPLVDNTGEDSDKDDVPIEWEWKWNYDPFKKDNHYYLDPDDDGLDNLEEYFVSKWGSDPYRADVFIELDYMEESPDGVSSVLPEGADELLSTAFNRFDKVFHLDEGEMGGGGEIIPFDDYIGDRDLDKVYDEYFLHYDDNNWRRGVFRYSLIIYDPGRAGYNFRRGAFVLSSNRIKEKPTPDIPRTRAVAWASVYMHEMGHTFDFHNPGVDNPNFWQYVNYKSCMLYRYTYRLVDYSDGSRINDFNDWEDMDLKHFQREW